MESYKGLPILYFETQAAWEAWLEEHQADSQGLWLKISKKDSGFDSVSYSEALDLAICYGWIDSQKGTLDDDFWLQRFTPRGSRSKWSQRNRAIADQMIQQGRIRSAGLREVELAKQDGRWEAASVPKLGWIKQRNRVSPRHSVSHQVDLLFILNLYLFPVTLNTLDVTVSSEPVVVVT